jgi:ribosomal protein S18 acetylase RimI-like enzyme
MNAASRSDLRVATTADIPIIRAIAHRTWPHAYFPHILDQAQLDYMLILLYSPEALSKVMTEKNQRFLIGSTPEGPAAFAGYTPHHHPGVTHLNKLYVLPAQQGTGMGHLLMEQVLEAARQAGDTHIELNVNKRNKAIAFYERHGFRILRDEVIDIGSGYVMDDHVMGRAL